MRDWMTVLQATAKRRWIFCSASSSSLVNPPSRSADQVAMMPSCPVVAVEFLTDSPVLMTR